MPKLPLGASSPDGQLAIPPLSGRVIDQTGSLTAGQQAALSAKLAQIESQHGSQVVVLIVATLQGEDIAS